MPLYDFTSNWKSRVLNQRKTKNSEFSILLYWFLVYSQIFCQTIVIFFWRFLSILVRALSFGKCEQFRSCHDKRINHFLYTKIWIWEAFLLVVFLRLGSQLADYLFCEDITAPYFQPFSQKTLQPFERKLSTMVSWLYGINKQTVGCDYQIVT